jgi:uncharacterized membrane protein YedE/YeeE
MYEFIELISQPWPWYVAGPIIGVVMFSLLLFGDSFGLSANLRTMCTLLGAGKKCDFFDFNWRSQIWNLVFATGLVLGGYFSHNFLTSNQGVNISEQTIHDLESLGIESPGSTMVPESLFSFEALGTLRGFIMLVVGGFLVGFGTRYAGGCTSGHAISGLSDLQLPSLIAVVGFFIGGLLVTHFVLPHLLTL